MSLPYPYVTNDPNHINTGSYFNALESNMFITTFGDDLWYGFSGMDVIELSVYDLKQNPVGWATTNTQKEYKTVTLSYLNTLDQPVEYSYQELQSDFILYKNTKILVNPIEDLQSVFQITQGSYLLTYNFIRQMAGDPLNLLVIKDISPSRKEIKLIPLGGNNPRYEAFCKKKFQIKDVAPVLLQVTKQCPYSDIYNRIQSQYVKEISFLKQLLFLETDGAVIAFLKSLYEDIILYTNPSSEPVEKIKRTQGIKTYYQNYLLSNYETISDFVEINNYFDSVVSIRIEKQFKPYGVQKGNDFVNAKKFLFDFFTIHFYQQITLTLRTAFNEKYYSYFKNSLNLGNNLQFVILDHSYIEERENSREPLTLLLKLKTELPDIVKKQTECWVSNISIAPYVVNAIFRKESGGKTIKISPPNFLIESNNVSFYNQNQLYSFNDLQNSVSDQQTININKKIDELKIDYTNFSNFVIFSSAEQRLSNFKKKISTWYMLSSSLVTLNTTASQSLSMGSSYPRYSFERASLEGQMTDIVNTFDGYESYLFRTGSYTYNPTTATFYSESYVSEQDYTASIYDKTNRDNLVNNTPLHITLDANSEEYVTFLNMIGHFFDNLYLYITNIPSERIVENDPTKTVSKKMVDFMLNSFGWEIGSSYEDLTTLQAYSTTATSSMSSEERARAIRTRILNSLPQIYKTKGTEEAIKLLLACHGIPSNLLDIREYGGDDYNTASLVTYTKRERSCLIGISGSGIQINQLYAPRPDIRTIEFKLSIEHSDKYISQTHYPLVNAYHTYGIRWDAGWLTHSLIGSASVSESIDRGYYYLTNYPAWEIGFIKEYGHMGRMYAGLPTYTSSLSNGSPTIVYSGSKIAFGQERIFLTSSLLPIFDGEIFNVRLRRNEPNSAYQSVADIELVPSIYDLTVQRNESGRQIFKSFHSILGLYEDNMIWDGRSIMDIWETTGSIGTTNTCSITWGANNIGHSIYASIGNAMVWDVPISDGDFEVHCNDFSSFSYTGSDAEKHLITRMDSDEAINFLSTASAYIIDGVYISGSGYGIIPNKSEYYSVSSSVIRTINPISITYTSSNYYPLNPTASSNTCGTQSIIPEYPYEYIVKNLEKTYTTPYYGPNRFKNEKVKRRLQKIAARLDDKDRSTYDYVQGVQADSNLLGLYLDPQDAKNRDIIKFFGNTNIVDLIADPANMYSSSYVSLKEANEHYNSFGDRQVLYNELITLYKIYFNRSIFESVKNILPARASTRTGILIEPTVLERPKYEYKPIFTEVNTGSVMAFDITASRYFRDPITKLVRFSGSAGNVSDGKLQMLFGEFNIDTTYSMSYFQATSMPANPTINLDVSYINEANFIYPINYNNGYICDISDDLQLGNYGSLGGEFEFSEAWGVTTQEDLNTYTNSSGSGKFFLVKKWNRHIMYSKSGSHIKTSNRNEDMYTSNSIWLYNIVSMSPDGYNHLFYTSSKYEPSGSSNVLTENIDVFYIGGIPHYLHRANTAKNTPNAKTTTLRGTEIHIPMQPVYVGHPYRNISEMSYFEVFGGYPRNHYIHKAMQYSPVKYKALRGNAKNQTAYIYGRSRQTIDTTIDNISGLEDASLPIQSIETSNVNLVQSDNVINQ